jgi:hypothetical protein
MKLLALLVVLAPATVLTACSSSQRATGKSPQARVERSSALRTNRVIVLGRSIGAISLGEGRTRSQTNARTRPALKSWRLLLLWWPCAHLVLVPRSTHATSQLHQDHLERLSHQLRRTCRDKPTGHAPSGRVVPERDLRTRGKQGRRCSGNRLRYSPGKGRLDSGRLQLSPPMLIARMARRLTVCACG